MGKIQEYFKDKSVGFYFTMGITLLSIISAIVYATSFGGTDSMSWWAFAFMLVGCAGAVALVLIKQYKWAPISLAVFNFLALLFFIYGVYYYVSVVMVGIDLTSFDPWFFVNVVMFVLTFGVSVANIFLKQTKEVK